MSIKEMVIEEQISLTPPGYWGSSLDNIFIIYNFISKEESEKINNYIRVNTVWDETPTHDVWKSRVHHNGLFTDNSIKLITKNIIDRVKLKIENTLSVELADNAASLVRWRVGDGQGPHADKQLNDGTPNMYPQNDIASLVYLNDDYEGGEIYFPNQNFKVKPSKNSLIFFPGDINYLHGVTTIEEGIRYTMPSFWKVTKISTNHTEGN